MSSPLCEEHMEVSEIEFAFGVETVSPLTDVSFRRDSSGRDLKFLEHSQLDSKNMLPTQTINMATRKSWRAKERH